MLRTSYLNFDLLLHANDSNYEALVLNPLVGDTSVINFQLPFTDDYLVSLGADINLPYRHIGPNLQLRKHQRQDAQLFGTQLYQAVFSEPLQLELIRSLDRARKEEKGLRLRLFFDKNVTELAVLPWELLYSPTWGRFLALSSEVPLVRYIQTPQPPRAFEIQPPLRILAMVSNPIDVDRLEVEREWEVLKDAISTLDAHRISLERLPVATYDALQARLQNGPVHVLHFMGHGYFGREGNIGGLILEDENHHAKCADASQLAALLHAHHTLRLVFLNACDGAHSDASNFFSGIAQRFVQQEVPSVVAMQFPIHDLAALKLAQTFYAGLAAGFPVDTALTEARVALYGATQDIAWATPVLFSRLLDNQLLPPRSTQFIRKSYESEVVLIPSGPFWMGSEPGEGIPPNETDRHEVILPDYYIGKYPVTNAEYAVFIQETGRLAPAELGWAGNNPPEARLRHPVAGVTWNEAIAYCEWLSEVTKRKYTLPTEAHWEKAARGTDGRSYPWGQSWEPERCNPRTSVITPVDAYPQGVSPYGCYDMVGNVCEWTCTLWGEKWGEQDRKFAYPWKMDDRNRLTANQQIRRVVRGGSSLENAALRITRRSSEFPSQRGLSGTRMGFRVMFVPDSVS